jgi:hypothetical protein
MHTPMHLGTILKLSRNLSILLSIALVGLLTFGYQIATADTASKTLVACSDSNTGDLRLAQSVCNSNETDITGDLLASEGLAGEPGAQGLDGKDGNDGQEGADCKNGVAGRDGTNGTNGIAGATGAAGAAGATGATGAAGPAGPAGPAGTSSGSGMLFTPVDLVPTGWSTIQTDVLLAQVIVEGYYKSVVVLKNGNSNPLLSMYVPEMSDWTNATGIKVTAYMTASASGNAKFEIGAKGYALDESLLDPGWNITHLISFTPGKVSKVTRTMSNTDGLFNIAEDEFYEFGFARRAGDAEDVNTGDVYLLGIIIEPTF